MMVKKGLKVILSMVLAVSLLTPFNIYADTITDANIIGYNFEVGGSTILATRERSVAGGTITDYNRQINYNCTVIFDDNFVGEVTINFRYYWYQQNSDNSISNSTSSQVRTLYLDGNTATFSFGIVSWYNADPLVTQSGLTISPTLTITSSNVVVKDMNADIMKQWNIPIESYGFITYSLQNYSDYLYSFQDLYYYQFPIYRINTAITLYEIWLNSNKTYDLIFIDNFNTSSQASFLQHYSLDGVTINSFKNTPISKNMNIIHIKFTTNSNSWYYLKSKYTYNIEFIPIYFNESNNKNISSDFAIRFGLRNELLDNIQTIANGTTASQSAAVDSQTANSQLQTSSNQLFTQEDSFKSDMNNAMQNIPSFSVNNFGSKFMTSATWVRQQYERITNNTPFQQVITFSLLVGLSMILIGKVRK